MSKMDVCAVPEPYSIFQTFKPGSSQKVSFTGTSAQSSALGGYTKIVRLFATEDCWIKMGTDPTAAASAATSTFVPGGIIQYFVTKPGDKIAVIRDTTSGSLHILEPGAVS